MREKLSSPLFVAVALALLCVAVEFTHLANHIYLNVLYKFASAEAVQDAAIVSLDDGKPISANAIGSSTGEQAKLIDWLLAQKPKAIFLDYPMVSGVDPDGDAALKAVIARGGETITMVNRAELKIVSANTVSQLPEVRFAGLDGTRSATSAWRVNYLGAILTSPRSSKGDVAGRGLPTVASLGPWSAGTHDILPELRVKPEQIAVVSAQTMNGASGPQVTLTGRKVFVTYTNPSLDSALRYPGYSSKVPGAVADIAGLHGQVAVLPFNPGDWPLLGLFLLMILGGRRCSQRYAKWAIYAALPLLMLVLPAYLRGIGVTVELGAAAVAMIVYIPYRSIQKWRSRVQLTNSVSGLPNVESLTREGVAKSQDVVAVVVSQYEHILASLPRDLHGECAVQIARRLSLGSGDRAVFDADNGHFVWLDESRTLDDIVGHFEGLRALFSSPLIIGEHKLDTTIHFGLDRNGDNRPGSRVQSALASASDAQQKSKLYEDFGHERLAQSPWELSIHARIDEGLQNGAIWLALQPQLDFRSGRISGAEALIRWNDPERGVVPPDVFILQAERAGRIDAITYWVLIKAIAMSHQLNRIAGPFQISVNLSARMVDHPMLVSKISDIVREHPVDCSLITLEVTETFSMANKEAARSNLAALRTMGFRLSIDDFGTGQASLAYLAEIPSDEIKLDRRFVQNIVSDPRERLIVDSVIRLGHALGQEVVAEGIEDGATLEALRTLDCDLAQGYHIGKPVKFGEFTRLLAASQSKTASG